MTINQPLTLDQVQTTLGALPVADLPVALFPVRLETRFVAQGTTTHLCVRVLPDEIHVDNHEPALTEDEERWGRRAWEHAWRAGGDAAAERAVQDDLSQRFGAGRAAWIARVLAPLNPASRPNERVPDATPLAVPPEFPAVARRAGSWTRASRVQALPDRWVMMAYRGTSRVLAAVGLPIPATLHAGPDPQAPAPAGRTDDRLAVDPGMHWLVDFEKAVEVGMALRIPLASAAEATKGYDRLVVLGVRKGDGQVAAAEVAALLEAQRYSDSLAFVPQGTPSNNTGEAVSGYAASQPHLRTALLSARNGGLPDPESNQLIAAAALGVAGSTFDGIPHATDMEQADARHANTALWPATWGYFLRYVLLGAPITDEEIERTRRHFVDHVRARGPMPVLRVGRQPYGVLPVVSLDTYAPDSGDIIGPRTLTALRALRHWWLRSLTRVPQVTTTSNPALMSDTLTSILRTQATTDHVQTRLALPGALYGIPQRAGLASTLATAVQARSTSAMGLLKELGTNGHVPGSVMAYTQAGFQLTDRLVGGIGADGTLLSNYIAAIRAATFPTLLDEELDAGRGSNSVLYLLLRHAMLLAYIEAAYRIQRDAGTLPAGALREEPLIDVYSAGSTPTTFAPGQAERTRTPLRVVLDAPAPAGHATPLREIIHTFGVAQAPGAAMLDEMRASLDHLASAPARDLDALLRETLDLGSHRLDAWVTSIATARLRRLRAARPTGLILGGYGWVENLKAAAPAVVAPDPPGEAIAGSPIQDAAGNHGYIAAPSLTHAATAAILRSGYRAYGSGGAASAPFAIDLSSERVRLAQWLLDGVRQGQPLAALLGYRFERALRENRLAKYIRPFRLIAPFTELYQLQALKAELEQQRSGMITTHNSTRAPLTAAIDALQAQINSLNAQITTKTTERTTLQTRVNSLNQTLIPAAQKKVNAAQAEVDACAGRLRNLSNRPPNDEARMEAQLNLNSANKVLQSAKDNLNTLVTERDTKQTLINTRTSEINIATSERSSKQKELDKKTAERATLDKNHKAALAAKDAEIAAVTKQITDQEIAYRERYAGTPSLPAMEAIEAQHVTDGLELLRKWKAGEIRFGVGQLPKAGTGDAPALVKQLDTLAATVDAVGDLLTAEGVHQLVQGNELRAGATLDAVARGETPPPEPDVVRTPRSGSAHTHRLAVLLPGSFAAPAAWKTDSLQQRAEAEPSLNAWLATVLPDPARVRIEVTYLHPQTGEQLANVTSPLSTFRLSPLDAVHLAPADGASAGSPLEDVIVHTAILQRPAGCRADARIHIQHERGEDWPVDDVGFGAFLEAARAARELIGTARAIDARDLARPEENVAPLADAADMKLRADRVTSNFRLALQHLRSLFASAPAEELDLGALRLALTRLSWFGMPQAIPRSAAGESAEDRRVLLEQANAVEAEATRKVVALNAAESRSRTNLSARQECDVDVERIQIVLGGDFRVLPRFRPPAAETLAATFGRSLALQGQDPMASVTWLQQMAHVRDGAGRLATTLMYAEALDASAGLRFTVGQLPHDPAARWVALPLDAQQAASTPCVSLVAHMAAAFEPSAPISGLLVDEWMDLIPAARETAAVAFHYDAPSTQAPQSILLAVPPDTRSRWDVPALEAVLQETLDLAKVRAVDPTALAGDLDHGHMLPALYVPFNAAGDTVSTDLSRAAAR